MRIDWWRLPLLVLVALLLLWGGVQFSADNADFDFKNSADVVG